MRVCACALYPAGWIAWGVRSATWLHTWNVLQLTPTPMLMALVTAALLEAATHPRHLRWHQAQANRRAVPLLQAFTHWHRRCCCHATRLKALPASRWCLRPSLWQGRPRLAQVLASPQLPVTTMVLVLVLALVLALALALGLALALALVPGLELEVMASVAHPLRWLLPCPVDSRLWLHLPRQSEASHPEISTFTYTRLLCVWLLLG